MNDTAPAPRRTAGRGRAPAGGTDGRRPRHVHPGLVTLAGYAWRILVVAAAVIALILLLGRLLVVVIALAVAMLLTRVLAPVADWLRDHRLPPALASAIAVVGFVVAVIGLFSLIGFAVFNQAKDVGPTVQNAVNDIQTWLVEDSPFPVDEADVQRFRDSIGEGLTNALSTGGAGGGSGARSGIVSGATMVFEFIVAILLGLVITFFAVKDGRRFRDWIVGLFPRHRRRATRAMISRAWETIGGYLKGSALLGLVEGVAIGVTLFLVGSELAIAMGVLTFFAAFVPFVGAIVAGLLSVLVALATAGLTGAIIVAAVAFLVQQFDSDLLAPVVFGKALSLHPVVVLVAITAGGALFGLIGVFLAVPVVAVLINVTEEAQKQGALGGDDGVLTE
jgi:predicted PurR-regulated permease PerM